MTTGLENDGEGNDVRRPNGGRSPNIWAAPSKAFHDNGLVSGFNWSSFQHGVINWPPPGSILVPRLGLRPIGLAGLIPTACEQMGGRDQVGREAVMRTILRWSSTGELPLAVRRQAHKQIIAKFCSLVTKMIWTSRCRRPCKKWQRRQRHTFFALRRMCYLLSSENVSEEC